MNSRITAERKLYELRCLVDDLTSLRQTDDGLQVLREAEPELKSAERRLNVLSLDVQS